MQIKTIRIACRNSNHLSTERCVVLKMHRFQLLMELKARLNSRPVCSGCGCKRPDYDDPA